MGQKISSNKNIQSEEFHTTTAEDDSDDDSEHQDRKSPAVSGNYRDIILDCFGKASSDTAARILMRIGQQRSDFKIYKENLTHEQYDFLTNLLSEYLSSVIENIDDAEKVKELSMKYGSHHVSLRLNGFKPDFFAAMADAIATECSFLSESATTHAPATTFKAWTLLVGLMFSSVRDGFYQELRRQRRQSPCYLMSSRESSVSMDHVGNSDARSKDFVTQERSTIENSRSIRNQIDDDKTVSTSSNSPFRLAHSISNNEESNTNYQTSLLPDDNADPECITKEMDPINIPKPLQRYQKSKSTSSFTKSLSSSTSLMSADDNYHHSHMERLKRAIRARTTAPSSTDGPLIGRFLKNPSTLADYDTKRHHRIDEIIKHHTSKHFTSKSPPAAIPTFDPNKIIDDFMNDRYKV